MPERNEALAIIEDFKCSVDPLYWSQTYTQTENPHYAKQGLPFRSPFPQKNYFRPLFEEFSRSERLLVPKSRQMLTSWCSMIWATVQAQWKNAFVVVQTQKEDTVQELVGYAECLYRNQADWLKELHPLKGQTSLTEITWQTGGRILGIPKGVHQIRALHPTIVIFDECAFLEEFRECWNTAHPVTNQMIGISSAAPGAFAEMCSR